MAQVLLKQDIGRNIRVVIIPSFLAFTFLAIWIASGTAPLFIAQDRIFGPDWRNVLAGGRVQDLPDVPASPYWGRPNFRGH